MFGLQNHVIYDHVFELPEVFHHHMVELQNQVIYDGEEGLVPLKVRGVWVEKPRVTAWFMTTWFITM